MLEFTRIAAYPDRLLVAGLGFVLSFDYWCTDFLQLVFGLVNAPTVAAAATQGLRLAEGKADGWARYSTLSIHHGAEHSDRYLCLVHVLLDHDIGKSDVGPKGGVRTSEP